MSDIMPHAKEERNCPNMNDDATHPAHTTRRKGPGGWGRLKAGGVGVSGGEGGGGFDLFKHDLISQKVSGKSFCKM